MSEQHFHYNVTANFSQVKGLVDSFNKVSTESVKVAKVLESQDKKTGAMVTKVHALTSANEAYSVTIKKFADGQVQVGRAFKLGAAKATEYAQAIQEAEAAVESKIEALRRHADATAKQRDANIAALKYDREAKVRISEMEAELGRLSAARKKEARAMQVQLEAANKLAARGPTSMAEASRRTDERMRAEQIAKQQRDAMLGVATGSQAAAIATAKYNSALTAQLGVAPQVNAVTKQQKDAMLGVATGAQAAATQQQRLTQSKKQLADQAKATTKEVTLSWKGIMRLVQVQILHRIFAMFSRYLREAAQAAIEFNLAVAEIQTISLRSAATSAQWAGQLRLLNQEFGSPMPQLAEAAYQGLSNQVMQSINDMTFLRENVRLATVAVGTMEQAVGATTSVINAFGYEAYDAAHISGVLFKSIEMGRIRLEEMADALGRVSMLSSQLGVSFEEQQAAFATLTIQGVKFNVAQTLLSNVMLKLIKPSERMIEIMDKYGVSSGEAAVSTYTFAGWMNLLASEADKSNDVMEEFGEIWGRLRAMTGAAGLMFNLETYQRTLDEMTRGAEDFDSALQKIMENPAKKLQIELEKVKTMFMLEWGNFLISWGNFASESFGGLDKIIKFLIVSFRNLAITMVLLKTNFLGAGTAIATFNKLTAASGTYLTGYKAGLTKLRATIHMTKAAVIGLGAALKTLAPFLIVSGIMALADQWGKAKRQLEEYANELDRLRMLHQQALEESLSATVRTSQKMYRDEMQQLMMFVAFVRKELSAIHEPLVKSMEQATKSMAEAYKEMADAAKAELKGIEDAHKKLQDVIERAAEEQLRLQQEKFIRGATPQDLAREAAAIRREAVGAGPEEAAKLIAEAEKYEKALDAIVKRAERLHESLWRQQEEVLGRGGRGLIDPTTDRNIYLDQLDELRRLQTLQRQLQQAGREFDEQRINALDEIIARVEAEKNEEEAKIAALQKQEEIRTKIQAAVGEEDLQKRLDKINQIMMVDLQDLLNMGPAGIAAYEDLGVDYLRTLEAQTQELLDQKTALDDIGEKQRRLRDAEAEHTAKVQAAATARGTITGEIGRQIDMMDKALLGISQLTPQEVQLPANQRGLIATALFGPSFAEGFDPLRDPLKEVSEVVLDGIHAELDALKSLLDSVRELETRGRTETLDPEEITRLTTLQTEAAERIAALLEHDEYREYLEDSFPAFTEVFNTLTGKINEASDIYTQANTNAAGAAGALADLEKQVKDLEEQYPEQWEAAKKQLDKETQLDGLRTRQVTLFGNLNTALEEAVGRIAAFPKPVGAQHGGLVRGPGGIDRVPAMLTAGEYVWDAATTRQFYPIIRAMHESRGASPLTNNYGNINVSIHGSDSPQLTARAVIKEMKREMRRGTV